MKKWQKIAICLIVLLFVGVHQKKFVRLIKKSSATVYTTAQLDSTKRTTQDRYKKINKKISNNKLNVYEYADYLVYMRIMESKTRAHKRLSKTIERWADMVADKVVKNRTRHTMSLEEQQKYNLFFNKFSFALDKANKKYGQEVDWGELARKFKWFYINFLYFSILILLVKRWPKEKFYFANQNEIYKLMFSIIFWPIGIFAEIGCLKLLSGELWIRELTNSPPRFKFLF